MLTQLLNACRARTGTSVNDDLVQSTRSFLAHANAEPDALRQLAATARELPPPGAAWVALTLGTAIEQGARPEIAGPTLLEHFRHWMSTLPHVPPGEDDDPIPEPTPEQAALLESFPEICTAVVAHLARMPDTRRALASDDAFIARLEELESYGWGATWVREALLRTSGTLVVLHPPSGKGLRLRYENVHHCFHLFSLIQTAIGTRIPGGKEPDPNVAGAARGHSDQSVSDAAWWHFGDPRSPTAEIGASIWGEAPARSIPFVDDVQVILLWPTLLGSRSWDSGFFNPHLAALPADAFVESELTAEQVRSWFDKLGIDASK